MALESQQKKALPANGEKIKKDVKNISIHSLLLLLLILVFFASLMIGRYPIDPYTVLLILAAKAVDMIVLAFSFPSRAFAPFASTFPPLSNDLASAFGVLAATVHPIKHTWPVVMETVIWQIRFPRTIAVMLVGAGLSVSGATFQGTFRNPLVSENILGVAAGATVGASLGIIMNQGPIFIQMGAFIGGISAVTLTYLISRVYRSNPTLVLVLAGIIVGSLFGAMTSLIKYIANTDTQLPDITYWLMGSFAKITPRDVILAGPIILIPLIVILMVRWRLNVLSMGDQEARALGLDTNTIRIIAIICVTLMTAASVSISGMIAWVGLVIPHIGRMLVGPDHKSLIPATILIGASFMMVVDIICRDLTTIEIPVSIVMSIIGAPIFLYLLKKSKESWS